MEYSITPHMHLASLRIKQPIPLSLIHISKEDALECLSIKLATIFMINMLKVLTSSSLMW